MLAFRPVCRQSVISLGWFSLAHKHKHKKLRSKWEHQDISIRAYAGAVITKFLDTSFPQLQSRWRIITLMLMLISLAFALRHKHNISTRRTNNVRSSCAYVVGVLTCLCECLCLCLWLCLCASEKQPFHDTINRL